MKKNVGMLDSHIRLFLGFSLLGRGILHSSKTMVGLGALKIATGITRFCPIFHVLKISSMGEKKTIEEFAGDIHEYTHDIKEELGFD